jgi:pimeloyl-ACP methyl ester carboxylesterase
VIRSETLRVRTDDGAVLDVHLTHDVGTDAHAPVVVVCHGFVQNALAFEVPQLAGTRSLLAHLRSLGFHVATLELRGRTHGAHESPTAHGLHEYTDVDVPAVLRALKARGHTRVGWVGHSMGGLVATALPPEARDLVDAVVTLGSPLFAGRPHLHVLEGRSTAALVRGARRLHGRGLPFRGRAWSNGLHSMRRVLDVPWIPAPVRLWAPGSLADDALAFTLQRSFADDSFAVLADLLELVVTKGDRAGRVDMNERLARFDRPALVIAGDVDDLAPPVGARPLFERLGTAAAHKQYVEARAGHIDLVVGAAAPTTVWPAIAAFLRRHLR